MAEILLVDDMKGVRRAIRASLDRAGHAVTEAENGAAAIALLREKNSFDIVITDMVMPGQDGTEVILFVTGQSPRPKCLAMSGGASNLSTDEALRLARGRADAVLTKPFDAAELIEVVNRLLPAA